jgi:hypothetical protein
VKPSELVALLVVIVGSEEPTEVWKLVLVLVLVSVPP